MISVLATSRAEPNAIAQDSQNHTSLTDITSNDTTNASGVHTSSANCLLSINYFTYSPYSYPCSYDHNPHYCLCNHYSYGDGYFSDRDEYICNCGHGGNEGDTGDYGHSNGFDRAALSRAGL